MRGSARERVSATYGSHPFALITPTRAVRLFVTIAVAGLLLSATEARQLTAIRVPAGGDLQTALNNARPGQTILLAPGAEYVGALVLPPRTDQSSEFITIRTDGQGLPGPGVRTGPQYAGKLAVIRSGTAAPALRTSPATHHWRIENVEFAPTSSGDGDIIALGSGDREQDELADVPHDLVLDRVYVHGDSARGQRRGIALNSAATTIVNSHIADIKGAGIDTQAICGWNGPGPFTIENNYLEAAGENVMFGGADPWIDQLVPAGIVIRGNHVARPVAWRQPILAPPTDVTAVATGENTSLTPGTYTYSVVAERPAAGGEAVSLPHGQTRVVVKGGGTSLRWTPVPGASSYRVYRSGADGSFQWRVAEPQFTDQGPAGSPGTPPTHATTWTVKNLLELKNARDVTITGNLFEHHWPQAQSGYAIVFTPRNQDGRAPWSEVSAVRFVANVVRQASGGVNISGTDDVHPSGRARDITLENNLFLDVGGEWGAPGDFVQIGNGPADVRISRNTAFQTGRALLVYGSKHGREVPGFLFVNNLLRHNEYGLVGDGVGIGRPAIAAYFPGGRITGNVFAGGRAADYPAGNRFESPQALRSETDAGRFAGVGADLTALRTSGQGVPVAPRQDRDR